MPEQRAANIRQVNLRLTVDEYERLKRVAKRNKRSVNQEMVQRLNRSFDREHADEILATAQDTLARASALNDLVMEKAQMLATVKALAKKGSKK